MFPSFANLIFSFCLFQVYSFYVCMLWIFIEFWKTVPFKDSLELGWGKRICLSLFWSFRIPSSRVVKKAEAKQFAFGLQLLTLKIGGWVQKDLHWPVLELPSFDFKSSRRGQCKKHYIWPPTFGTKSWRLIAKKLCSTNVGAFELKAQKLVEGPSANFLHLTFCGAFKLGTWKFQKGWMQSFLHLALYGPFELGAWKLWEGLSAKHFGFGLFRVFED